MDDHPYPSRLSRWIPLLAAIVALCASLWVWVELFRITVYRHNDLYYIDGEANLLHLKGEGRWINYWLYPWLQAVPGRVAMLAIVAAFLFFCFSAARGWTRNRGHALLIALLLTQAFPLYLQALWPSTSLASLLILALAACLHPYMGMLRFYLLFGVLFFGALSHLYYLLPLLHLSRLEGSSARENLKRFVYGIVPLWAGGFVCGYWFMEAVVYSVTGQPGIELAAWRNPHYVHNLTDLWINIGRSYQAFLFHLSSFLADWWRAPALLAALVVRIVANDRGRWCSVAMVSSAVLAAHYIILLPSGIAYQTRTALATWVGLLAAVLFPSRPKRGVWLALAPIIAFLTYSFAHQNRAALAWYGAVTDRWRVELRSVSPLPPQQYAGVILLSDDREVAESVQRIASGLGLHQVKGMETLSRTGSWGPAARAAGFKQVILCSSDPSTRCKDLLKERYRQATPADDRLYQVLGTDNGFLLVALAARSP